MWVGGSKEKMKIKNSIFKNLIISEKENDKIPSWPRSLTSILIILQSTRQKKTLFSLFSFFFFRYENHRLVKECKYTHFYPASP